jgi:hypothetical protein
MRVHTPLFVSLYHVFFVSQIIFVWLITSLLYNHLDLVVAFLVDFCLSTWLLIFYLGYFVCHLGLLCSFSDNFIVSCYLIKDMILLLSFISSSHHIIPLPAIATWGYIYMGQMTKLD